MSRYLGFLIVAIVVASIWILQSLHEDGAEWARGAQYLIGLAYVIYLYFTWKKGLDGWI